MYNYCMKTTTKKSNHISIDNVHVRYVGGELLAHKTDDHGNIIEKTCMDCLTPLPLDRFYDHKHGLGGKKPNCKECFGLANARWKKDKKNGIKRPRKNAVGRSHKSLQETNADILYEVDSSFTTAGYLTYLPHRLNKVIVYVEVNVNSVYLIVEYKDVKFLIGVGESIADISVLLRSHSIRLGDKLSVLESTVTIDAIPTNPIFPNDYIQVVDIKEELSRQFFDFTIGKDVYRELDEVLSEYKISLEVWERAVK